MLASYLDFQRATFLGKLEGLDRDQLSRTTAASSLYLAGESSRRTLTEAESLDQQSDRPIRGGQRLSLRWILLHMLEETARHNGHADVLRGAIDGVTGE